MKLEERPDGSPTLSEWPLEIQSLDQVPALFRDAMVSEIEEGYVFDHLIYGPPRKKGKMQYLLGYGKEDAFLVQMSKSQVLSSVRINRKEVTSVIQQKELLNTTLILVGRNKLRVDYVPSVYYLFDPFLNWAMNLPKDYSCSAQEQVNPRPQSLLRQSLPMFNYLLDGYRLGKPIADYTYKQEIRSKKWMPWKKEKEEWLVCPMERGTYEVHALAYWIEKKYQIGN